MGSDQVALIVPLALLALVIGLARGHLVVDRFRAQLYVAAMVLVLGSALVTAARGMTPSLLSTAFLLALYAPAIAVSRPHSVGHHHCTFFLRAMTVFAAVGLALFVAQYLGVPYEDWLARAVPESFLLRGYNTTNPIQYGAAEYRANGVLFLEPSFFSLFLGLAAVIALSQRRSAVLVTFLIATMLTTVAFNGAVVLLLGTLTLALSRRSYRLTTTMLPSIGILILLSQTRLGDVISGRTSELNSTGTSASLRLVEPYQVLIQAWLADTTTILFGAGAGSAADYYATLGAPSGLLAPPVAKLLYEFGFLTAAVVAAFIATSFLKGRPLLPWVPGLIVSYAVVNASLLQGALALTVVLFLVWLPPPTSCETPVVLPDGQDRECGRVPAATSLNANQE